MEPTSDPASEATALVEEIQRHVGYLRIALAAPADEQWIATSRLLEDPGLLLRSIRETGDGRGAPDDQVAASLWFQAYAFRVALPVVAPFALGLPGLSVDPVDTAIRIARNRPAAVAVTRHDLLDRSANAAATDLCAGHLVPMVEAITALVTVGHRLLWGNAAASLATVVRALDGAPGADRPAIWARTAELLDQALPWLGDLGEFETVTESGQVGWYWTRTNCCLYDRCDGGSRCDDCSLTSTDELERARRQALREAASEGTP